jgi:hypothetical protein
MSNTLGDYGAYPLRASGANTVVSRCVVAIGASGAATVDGDQGWTVTKNTTGTYDVTYPIVSSNARAILSHGIQLSAAATVARTYTKALTLTSGTAQIITYLNTAGTPVEPANGDYLWLKLEATIGGATP